MTTGTRVSSEGAASAACGQDCSNATADEVLGDLGLEGRTFVVTGADSGIGLETTRALAGHGGRVIMACRTLVKGRAVREELVAHFSAERRAELLRDRRTGPEGDRRAAAGAGRGASARSGDDGRRSKRPPPGELDVRRLDLGDLESVRTFAAEFPSLAVDALVCNAGTFAGGYQETADGFERTLGVSHVGHFLLAHLLLDHLRAAAPSRVVVVSSESHRGARRLDFGRLPLSRSQYGDHEAYAQAKLCNVLFAAEWERRYGGQGVHGASLHPGAMIFTGIGRRSLAARIAFRLARPFTKSPAQGAATSVHLAARLPAEELRGRYFRDCRPVEPSPAARDGSAARRLWETTAGWTGVG